MSWTEQQIQMLKDMWGHGYSASDIAGKLGSGLTRNAVIGKAHRLKLSSRPSPISNKPPGEIGVRLPLSSGGMPMKTARKRVMLRPLPVLPQPTTTAVVNRISTRDLPRPQDEAGRREGIAVTKAGERHCRWPIGDPRSPEFRFCGCVAYEGMPYCIEHARVAYQNVGRKHRAAESGEAASSGTGGEFRLPGQSRY